MEMPSTLAKTKNTIPLCRNSGVSRSRVVHVGRTSYSLDFKLPVPFICSILFIYFQLSIAERRRVYGHTHAVGNVFADFCDRLLRNENHVAGSDLNILLNILSVQEIFQFEFSCLHPAVRGTVIEINLGLCRRQKPACYGYRL